jgi:hypothetical protein
MGQGKSSFAYVHILSTDKKLSVNFYRVERKKYEIHYLQLSTLPLCCELRKRRCRYLGIQFLSQREYFMKNNVIASFGVFFLSLSSALATPSGDINLTPSSLKLKVYKFAVSTSPLCTDLITVIDNGSTPSEVDFTSTPDLGSGTLANGTYYCIAIEMSDSIKFSSTTASTSGACAANTENTLDVCRNQGDNPTSKLIDGTTVSCSSGVVDDKVTMYLSTYSNSSGSGDSFNPPTAEGGDGFYLENPLVVSSAATAAFVVNPEGKMCDDTNDTTSACEGSGSSATCNLAPPTFNFSAL